MEASRLTGLPVDTEVMDEEQLQVALDAGVHMLQVGARNALNYSLLRSIGRAVAKREENYVTALGAQVAPASVARVPLLEGDVHDLDGVQTVADHLFGLSDSCSTDPSLRLTAGELSAW